MNTEQKLKAALEALQEIGDLSPDFHTTFEAIAIARIAIVAINKQPNPSDPFRDRVLAIALKFISQWGEVTTRQIIDYGNFGEHAVRNDLAELVAMEKLRCMPGKGSRPNTYYLGREA